MTHSLADGVPCEQIALLNRTSHAEKTDFTHQTRGGTHRRRDTPTERTLCTRYQKECISGFSAGLM